MNTKILAILVAGLASINIQASDSTQSVVSNLTQRDSFQAAPADTVKRLWTGKTTGRVNIPSGYDQITVNGRTHHIGKGQTTIINIQSGTSTTRHWCETSSGGGGWGGSDNGGGSKCSSDRATVSVPDCNIIITDTYVQGCNTVKSWSTGACESSSCYPGSSIKFGGTGYVRSIVGVKK
ncbi:hypothetical protein AB6E94_19290 [Vibrio lentus]|uniref:hypothetical protein n=1 Tax=Vibrio splendidus TaxID=29497 RepID=UPI000C82ED39|nr:hypothetical protein [Vibrio splendidus]PMG17845.1 hypothetical protein BCU98_00500 [Vibrio splendidus]